MIKLVKESDRVTLRINSASFREADLIISDKFRLVGTRLFLYDDMDNIMYEINVDSDFMEYLTKCMSLDCYIKLKNSIVYGVKKVLKKT